MKLLLKFLALSIAISGILALIGQMLGLDPLISVLYASGVTISAVALGQRKFQTGAKIPWILAAVVVVFAYLLIPTFSTGETISFSDLRLIVVKGFSQEWPKILLIFVASFFEELGWREFLYNKLKSFGWIKMNILVGLTWSVWHWPAVFTGSYGLGSNLLLGLCVFTLNLILLSFIFAWLRNKAGSIWPVVIAHGIHNITYNYLGFDFVVSEYSFVLTLSLLCFVFITHLKKVDYL